MKKDKLATQKPHQSPITLTDAQNQITLVMQRAFLEGWDDKKIETSLVAIIERAVQGLPIEGLSEDAVKSLYNHANRVRMTLSTRINPIKLRESVAQYNSFEHSKFREKLAKPDFNEEDIHIERTESGMPLSFWNAREYIRKRVLPVMDELSQMQALDPNDYSGRNSLRNLAEMEVRYHNHELSIQELKVNNEKLVVCSTHADCSKRCAPYQGRVYSLDGTSGKTDDGRDYVPLEDATQNPEDRYPTKAGKVYQNGLLGFNCRHKLRPYISGVKPEEISEDERQKQYRINNEERSRERHVRTLKLKSDLYKDYDDASYKKTKLAANNAAAAYREFCKKNNRAFYSERLQVLHPSTKEQREKYRQIEKSKSRLDTSVKLNAFLDNKIDKNNVIVYNNSIGLSSVVFADRKPRINKEYEENGIVDIVTKRGELDRTYYDANGIMVKQLHTSHSHPINGVTEQYHIHEYVFAPNGEIIVRDDRPLNKEEENLLNDFITKRKL